MRIKTAFYIIITIILFFLGFLAYFLLFNKTGPKTRGLSDYEFFKSVGSFSSEETFYYPQTKAVKFRLIRVLINSANLEEDLKFAQVTLIDEYKKEIPVKLYLGGETDSQRTDLFVDGIPIFKKSNYVDEDLHGRLELIEQNKYTQNSLMLNPKFNKIATIVFPKEIDYNLINDEEFCKVNAYICDYIITLKANDVSVDEFKENSLLLPYGFYEN